MRKKFDSRKVHRSAVKSKAVVKELNEHMTIIERIRKDITVTTIIVDAATREASKCK